MRTITRSSRTQLSPTLKQMNRLAWLLDNSIRIPFINYRIGWDAIIGLIPGLGDWAGMLLSSYIVIQAIRLGAPRAVLVQMVLNIWIEAAFGVVPALGDIFDAIFKANIRNVQLLEAVLGDLPSGQAPKPMVSRNVIIGVIVALAAVFILIGWAAIVTIGWVGSLFGG